MKRRKFGYLGLLGLLGFLGVLGSITGRAELYSLYGLFGLYGFFGFFGDSDGEIQWKCGREGSLHCRSLTRITTQQSLTCCAQLARRPKVLSYSASFGSHNSILFPSRSMMWTNFP